MFPISLPPAGRALSVGLATALAAALALSGCSSTPKAAKKTPAAPTTTVVPTPAPFTVTGVPSALAEVIRPLYFGGVVPASPSTATALLKGDVATRAIPVIALTALAMKGDEERIRAAGCDGYIAKPMGYRDFLTTIEAQLA